MHDALTKNRAQVRDLLCQARHLRGWSQARADPQPGGCARVVEAAQAPRKKRPDTGP
jgi:hypothetical protein